MIFDKSYFEKVFEKPGAWGYSASEYEKTKYLRQLDAIARCGAKPDKILEVGCAEGLHTAMIAKAFPEAHILCVDISRAAIERAKQTCNDFCNVELIEADVVELVKKLPQRSFDVIIQSECLYYLFPRFLLQGRLFSYLGDMTRTLKDGGIFVTANGLNMVTGTVMGIYYSILRREAIPVFAKRYREFNEFRKKKITYDLRVFKLTR